MNRRFVIIFVLFFLTTNNSYALKIGQVEWKNGILTDLIFYTDTNVESIIVNFYSDKNISDSLITTDFEETSPGIFSLSTVKKIDGRMIGLCEFILKGSSLVDENRTCGLQGKEYLGTQILSPVSKISDVVYVRETSVLDRDSVTDGFVMGIIFNDLTGLIPINICAFDFCPKGFPVILILGGLFFVIIFVCNKKL